MTHTALPIAALVFGLAGISGLAAFGWMRHGETLFLQMAANGWVPCL